MIKNVLIDVDGTIMDTREIFYKSLNETLKTFGLQTTDEKKLFGMSVDQTLTVLGIEKIAGIKKAWEDRFGELSEETVLFPYIKEFMEELASDGVKFIVVTSRSHATVDSICTHSEIGSYICGCIAAEDTVQHKPNPEPIRKALEKYNLDSSESMYIGDTHQDFLTASQAGVVFGLAGWNKSTDKDRYMLVFESPMDIVRYVRGEKNG